MSNTSGSGVYVNQREESAKESTWHSAWTKSTFLFFCWLSYGIFFSIGYLVYYLVSPRLQELHLWLDIAVFLFLILCIIVLGGGLLLITLTSLTGIDLLYPHKKQSVTVNLLFPIAITLAQVFKVNRDHLRASFIKVNNSMTIAQKKRIKGERLMILLPHCLQIDICNRKITNDINNCKRCGRCPVGYLLDLSDKYELAIAVVNGGTLALRKVKEYRPDGIVAVACERDLTSGVLEAYPVPVFGVINERPYGPCYNTNVDLQVVEKAMRFFKECNEDGEN